MLKTPGRAVALHGLGRIGAAAFDTVPAIVESWNDIADAVQDRLDNAGPRKDRHNLEREQSLAQGVGKTSTAALRAIYLAHWLEVDRQTRAHKKHWRQPLLERFRERWKNQPLGAAEQEAIEVAIQYGSRSQILAARLQAGDIARERVELAAALGDRPALQALGLPANSDDVDHLDEKAFERWAESLVTQPVDVRARIGQAAARQVLPVWLGDYPDDDCVEDAVHALEDWILSPTREEWARLREIAGYHVSQFSTPPAFSAGLAIREAAGLDGERQIVAVLSGVYHAWRATSGIALGWYFGKPRPFEPLASSETIAILRQAVRASVVPWALGEGDPVCEPLSRMFAEYPKTKRKR
jgi:hypothetical protein